LRAPRDWYVSIGCGESDAIPVPLSSVDAAQWNSIESRGFGFVSLYLVS
jgi:hypothetical protein